MILPTYTLPDGTNGYEHEFVYFVDFFEYRPERTVINTSVGILNPKEISRSQTLKQNEQLHEEISILCRAKDSGIIRRVVFGRRSAVFTVSGGIVNFVGRFYSKLKIQSVRRVQRNTRDHRAV